MVDHVNEQNELPEALIVTFPTKSNLLRSESNKHPCFESTPRCNLADRYSYIRRHDNQIIEDHLHVLSIRARKEQYYGIVDYTSPVCVANWTSRNLHDNSYPKITRYSLLLTFVASAMHAVLEGAYR